MMTGHGGFEGNAQSLRILSRLEGRTKEHGLDLTRRALLGVLKYPVTYGAVVAFSQKQHGEANHWSRFDTNFRTVQSQAWKPPKCHYDQDNSLVDWILSPVNGSDRQTFCAYDSPDEKSHGKSLHKSLDTTIMDLSDDISYGVHDLEDAIHMGFITRDNGGADAIDSFVNNADSDWVKEFDLQGIEIALFSEKWDRKEAIGRLINAFICSVFIQKYARFDSPLLHWRVALLPEAEPLLKGLKGLILDKVIKSPQVQTLEYRGQQVTMELFQALASDPERLLPRDTKIKWLEQHDDELRLRVVCDHISGMTDDYATRIYERLFLPRTGSLFQKM